MFDSRPATLNTPGRAGYPAYSVDIISPELPCGAGWLATALLELGIPLWRPWGIDDSNAWHQLSSRRWQYRFPGSGWSRLLPSLVDGRRFTLRPRPVPRLGHHWPTLLDSCPRRILFVRDPRDVLYSGWRRALKQGTIDPVLDAVEWMRRPLAQLPLGPAAYLRRFWGAWLAVEDAAQVLVVRFEDAKRDPPGTLRRVLDFIDGGSGARAVARACAAARHEHAARADRALAQSGIGPAVLAGGIVQEWRSSFTPQLHAAVGSRFDRLLALFGYPPGVARTAVADPDQAHADQLAAAILHGVGGGAAAHAALLAVLQRAGFEDQDRDRLRADPVQSYGVLRCPSA